MSSPSNSISIAGKLLHDRKGWLDADYQRIGSQYVGHWIENRINEIPEGAYVKLTLEVLDDRPE